MAPAIQNADIKGERPPTSVAYLAAGTAARRIGRTCAESQYAMVMLAAMPHINDLK